MEFLLVWIFSIIIGCMIGAAKDQSASGFIWSFLFGPLGVLVVLCLPNRKKEKEEAERKHQAATQMQLQQAQLQRLEQMQRAPLPAAQSQIRQLRIASGGEDLGDVPVPTVKLMLKTGKLTPQDYYFDVHANDWLALAECPDLK